jgi:hypothetical protein
MAVLTIFAPLLCELGTALVTRFPCNLAGFFACSILSLKHPGSPRKASNLSPEPSPNSDGARRPWCNRRPLSLARPHRRDPPCVRLHSRVAASHLRRLHQSRSRRAPQCRHASDAGHPGSRRRNDPVAPRSLHPLITTVPLPPTTAYTSSSPLAAWLCSGPSPPDGSSSRLTLNLPTPSGALNPRSTPLGDSTSFASMTVCAIRSSLESSQRVYVHER